MSRSSIFCPLDADACSEKFVKNIAGITKLEDGLKRLDKMTNDEALLANAEAMRLAHVIDKKVEGVGEKVDCIGVQVKDVDEMVQRVGKNVRVVEGKVQMMIEGAQRILASTPSLILTYLDGDRAIVIMQRTARNVDDLKRSSWTPVVADGRVSNTTTGSQLRDDLRKWQSPSDPSTNHNFASDRQHEGTAEWFCRGSDFEKWKVAGCLLWIHG